MFSAEVARHPSYKGVIELLWDIFGGTVNAEGYKVLDPHIGAIYGDSITTERQVQIYERLAAKGFAATNIVLGVGSFTYQFNTRDTFGFAAKGTWFQTETETYNIYKDPATDDGTKKSLKGLCAVFQDDNGEYFVETECTAATESAGALHRIYEDGKFYNETTLTEIRGKIQNLIYVKELV
jgi:nicotinamide phosphoribosyltransferase